MVQLQSSQEVRKRLTRFSDQEDRWTCPGRVRAAPPQIPQLRTGFAEVNHKHGDRDDYGDVVLPSNLLSFICSPSAAVGGGGGDVFSEVLEVRSSVKTSHLKTFPTVEHSCRTEAVEGKRQAVTAGVLTTSQSEVKVFFSEESHSEDMISHLIISLTSLPLGRGGGYNDLSRSIRVFLFFFVTHKVKIKMSAL